MGRHSGHMKKRELDRLLDSEKTGTELYHFPGIIC